MLKEITTNKNESDLRLSIEGALKVCPAPVIVRPPGSGWFCSEELGKHLSRSPQAAKRFADKQVEAGRWDRAHGRSGSGNKLTFYRKKK